MFRLAGAVAAVAGAPDAIVNPNGPPSQDDIATYSRAVDISSNAVSLLRSEMLAESLACAGG